jgi:hypothetical protein
MTNALCNSLLFVVPVLIMWWVVVRGGGGALPDKILFEQSSCRTVYALKHFQFLQAPTTHLQCQGQTTNML